MSFERTDDIPDEPEPWRKSDTALVLMLLALLCLVLGFA